MEATAKTLVDEGLPPQMAKVDFFFPCPYGEVRLTLTPESATLHQNGKDIDLTLDLFQIVGTFPCWAVAQSLQSWAAREGSTDPWSRPEPPRGFVGIAPARPF